jgi:hypothetical protein
MKKISLTQDKFVLVDNEDFEWLIRWKWKDNGIGYAVTYIDGKTIRMHRMIVNATTGKEVDHINGNRLDNRKINLRECTKSQNHMNNFLQKNNTTGYKGVSLFKRVNKYRAYIKKDNKEIHLGYFNNPKDAAVAYNEAAKEYFGEFARLNII